MHARDNPRDNQLAYVIPAKAGIQSQYWTPACAGVTATLCIGLYRDCTP
jgi:hypothetical protein